MFTALVISAALLQMATPPVTPWDGTQVRNIRPGTLLLRSVITTAYVKSRTFRELADEVEAARVVAFISSGQCEGRFAACLRLLSADGNRASVRIVIDTIGRDPTEIAALLAHELEHTAEIARSGGVRSAQEFRVLFETLGHHHAGGYETARAQEIARAVEREMRERAQGHGSGSIRDPLR